MDRSLRGVFAERVILANDNYYGHLAKISEAVFNDTRALSEYVFTSNHSIPYMLIVDIMAHELGLLNRDLGASVGRNSGAPRTARTWGAPTPAHLEALGRLAVLG